MPETFAGIVAVGDLLPGIMDPVPFRLESIPPPLPIFCDILAVIDPRGACSSDTVRMDKGTHMARVGGLAFSHLTAFRSSFKCRRGRISDRIAKWIDAWWVNNRG